MAWRIRGWNEIYEDHNSRKLKRLPWYREPSSNDSYAYAALIHREDGPAIYGVWSMLKKVAATAPHPNRGFLLRGQNQPHTTKTLAILTRMPEDLIKTAIGALLDPEIGWIEEIPDSESQLKRPSEPTVTQIEPPAVHLDEVAEHICARHPKPKTMSVQACGRLLEKIIEGAAEPAKWLKHIEAHHAWRCENEWADCEPRFVKTLAKWLQEDPMAPIPDSNQRKEEPDYVERF